MRAAALLALLLLAACAVVLAAQPLRHSDDPLCAGSRWWPFQDCPQEV